jgi:hypothetical protein
MPKSIQHIGPIEAASNLDSVVDGDGAALDFDTGTGTARLTAKGGAGTNRLLKLRTLLAGVVVDALTFAADGAASFLKAIAVSNGITIRGAVNFPGSAADVSPSAAIANNANIAIGTILSRGVVTIVVDNGDMAQVALLAGLGNTTIVNAIRGTWGTAAGAAFDFNVYWDGGSSQYRFENKKGLAVTIAIHRVGNFASQ